MLRAFVWRGVWPGRQSYSRALGNRNEPEAHQRVVESWTFSTNIPAGSRKKGKIGVTACFGGLLKQSTIFSLALGLAGCWALKRGTLDDFSLLADGRIVRTAAVAAEPICLGLTAKGLSHLRHSTRVQAEN